MRDLTVTLLSDPTTTYLVDATITHEDRVNDTLLAARQRKEERYAPLCKWLEGQGRKGVVVPLVFGTAGTRWRHNTPLLTRLGLKPRYSLLMQKLMTTTIIRDNVAIWQHHCKRTTQTHHTNTNIPHTYIIPTPTTTQPHNHPHP
eukprot:GHVN01046953.1.p1 GENE.GHVN01046953.1~~GHVN01046953.1.p1  ORF type:complete len:145 (+),score=19.42 GHVN01046953.1:310-744(+)